MYSYDINSIIKFNCDEIIIMRNQFFPLKMGKRLSLTDCFEVSLNSKRTNCKLCGAIYGNEANQIYAASNVLIITFKRKNHSFKYQNDVKFYCDIDISKYIINKNSENKNFKLKAVVSCYDNSKYLVDVLINGCFYRIVDWKNGMDVKPINFNNTMEYEPILLFYEIDYQGQLYEKMKKLQEIQTAINMVQYYQMMMRNFMFINAQNQNQYQPVGEINALGFNLKFLVIPENWNNDEKDSFPITPQVTQNFTVKETIDKFYSKLIKKREAIIKFTYNNNTVLDPNSEQQLCQLNINKNTIIYAIKSSNFDNLDLPNN
jgi:hypothetical protein